MTPDDFVYLREEDIHKHGGIVNHIKNSWWLTVPGRGLAFYPFSKRDRRIESASPQCNSNKEVTEHLRPKLLPEAEIKFFPSVLQPVDPKDFA